MRICDDLRQAVLQAAIQGKLTKQLPEDGSAADLLKQITAEKAKLIKEGKIKKEKPLPEITPDELPFDIPENWKWARLKDVCKSIQDGDHQPPPQTPSGVPFIVISNISSGKMNLFGTRYVPTGYFKSLSYERIGEIGDILFTVTGSYGIAVPVDIDVQFCFQRHIALLKPITLNHYLLLALKSPCIKKQCDDKATGTAQKTVGLKSLQQMIIPIPPLAEQQRIVARVEELMARIDDLEKTETELEKLKAAFPGDMKAALLQAAMQGKLTEQLLEDGDAADLINQIAKEKNRLIKEGKIKKEKPLPIITSEEVPFDIPENWAWIRLGDYAEKVTDQVASGSFASLRNNVKSLKEPDYAIMVKTADFGNGFTKNLTYTDKHGYEFLENSNLFGGELILSNIGSIGKVFIVPKLEKKMTLAPNSVMVRLVFDELRDFLFKMLLSPLGNSELWGITSGTAMKKFNKTDLKTILIPVPPLAEQKRIVEKLDKLLPLCDGLIEK